MLFPPSPPPSYWNEFSFRDGWARTLESLWAGKEDKKIDNLSSVLIPPDHSLSLSLIKYIRTSMANKKMSAPKGEDARMGHARGRMEAANKRLTQIEEEIKNVENDVHLAFSELQNELPKVKDSKEKEKQQQFKIIEAAKLRLQETKGKIKPPGSRLIAIRNIRLLKQMESWYRYAALRDLMIEKADPNRIVNKNPYPFKWCVPPAPSGHNEIDRAPLLNPHIGETLLFHGTGRIPLQRYVIPGGFNPLYAQENKDKGGYGMLGQGTYFTDSFALAMCYCACKICGDFECKCRSERGRKTSRNVVIARILLGTPRMYPSFFQKRLIDPLRKRDNRKALQVRRVQAFQNPATSQDLYRQFLDESFQSIFAQGLHGASTLFSFGSTANQYSIRHTAQGYLEFVVDFVIGLDSTEYSENLRAKLEEYRKQTSGVRGVFSRQSADSRAAHAILLDLVNKHDGVTEFPQPISDNELKGAVQYFLGKGPDVLRLEKQGVKVHLKAGGRLYGLLSKL